LWRYNLHYLEWICALPPEEALEAALDWTRRHPPGPDAVGWAPYPTSLRLASLCLLAASAPLPAAEELWASVWRQAEHLSRRLEYHLLGNHLLENGIALALVGGCFAGSDADRWRHLGLRILLEQLPEQILADGMHFERSPMYQARLTHALALLANTGDDAVRRVVVEPLRRMCGALVSVCHPDGDIALLNDSALGICHRPGAVVAFASAALGESAVDGPGCLPEAGYFTGRGAAGDFLICDAGALGPDYLPGHAHGDIFSFELSLGGRRVIVDSGTFDYTPSEMRRYCRSTAAHNTLTVNDADQAEFWAAFRVGRRGRPHDVRHEPLADGFTLQGWHDGFRHLPGAPIHRRVFRWFDDGQLAVNDTVTAGRPVTAASRLHLHPDCRVVEADAGMVQVECHGLRFSVEFAQPVVLNLDAGWYCPRFGDRQRNTIIVAESRGREIRIEYRIRRDRQREDADRGS
jgi:hypothetical protein